MLRVSVTIHPANGDPPREIAAAAIAQRGRTPGGQHAYIAMTATDGRDDAPVRAAIVEHNRSHGVWELMRLVLEHADEGLVDDLVPVLREALARRIFGSSGVSQPDGRIDP